MTEGLGHGDAVQRLQHFGQGGFEISSPFGQFRADAHHGLGVAAFDGVEHRGNLVAADRADQFRNVVPSQLAFAEGDGLIGDREGVAHAAPCGLGDDLKGLGFEFDAFIGHGVGQIGGNLLLGDVFQLELEAAREDRDRHFLRIGGGKQEFDVLGRLLQGLEEGVEAGGGEHVDFVDQVDLEAAAGRQVLGVVE